MSEEKLETTEALIQYALLAPWYAYEVRELATRLQRAMRLLENTSQWPIGSKWYKEFKALKEGRP